MVLFMSGSDTVALLKQQSLCVCVCELHKQVASIARKLKL